MAVAYGYARSPGRNQRTGNTKFLVTTQQPLRIKNLERQSEHRRYGSEGDISFVPVKPQAEHLLTIVLPHANHATIRDRPRIGTGIRTGQCKTGDFTPVSETRQIIVFLGFAAVMQQQFGRS